MWRRCYRLTPQHESVAPSRGLWSICRPYPGAHAPGEEYAAPPELLLRRQLISGRDKRVDLASCILHPDADAGIETSTVRILNR